MDMSGVGGGLCVSVVGRGRGLLGGTTEVLFNSDNATTLRLLITKQPTHQRPNAYNWV
jgi:hypothetical protein